jgi:diaminohydroxyphosphoribosylaminopyrimidine deaminase / 5-amino-6-(5-phosphoribosylamino)uracil reductase
MTRDEIYMKRAMELAKLGLGSVSPNPLVGCVIVHDNKIIGEGWHQKFGQAHAEVNAIDQVKDKTLLSASTLYVNLEPCSHFGKTPPCADLLIEKKIKKVIIANGDPNPKVNGGGIKKLNEHGIETIVGVLQSAGRELNRSFFTAIEKRRPYTILKWAQTSDGFIAKKNFDSKWISNEFSRQLVHKWRGEEDAVLVGTRTAQHDNPELNVREWSGRNPTRIVLDRFLRLHDKLKIFDRKQPTLCYNLLKHEEHPNLALVRVSEENFLMDMLTDLNTRNIQSLIVEGGAQTLNMFLEKGIWDEVRVFTSSKEFKEGVHAPFLPLVNSQIIEVGDDQLRVFKNHN